MLSKETLKRIEETLDEMFDTFLDDETTRTKTPSKTKSTDHNIPINIYDDSEKSVIFALIPGERKSNVKVELSDDLDAIEITVGSNSPVVEVDSSKMSELKHREFDDFRSINSFRKRSVRITKDHVYALDKITSHLEFGILRIYLPKMKSVKKDKPVIEVK